MKGGLDIKQGASPFRPLGRQVVLIAAFSVLSWDTGLVGAAVPSRSFSFDASAPSSDQYVAAASNSGLMRREDLGETNEEHENVDRFSLMDSAIADLKATAPGGDPIAREAEKVIMKIKRDSDALAFGASLTVIGMIFLACVLLVLANFKETEVTETTRRFLFKFVAILCSLLVNYSLESSNDLIFLVGQPNLPPIVKFKFGGAGIALIAFMRFAIIYAAVQGALYFNMGSLDRIVCIGPVGAYLAAVSSAQAWAVVQEATSVLSIYMVGAVILIATVFLSILRLLLYFILKRGQTQDPDRQEVEAYSVRVDNAVFGYTHGLLIARALMCCMTGSLPSMFGIGYTQKIAYTPLVYGLTPALAVVFAFLTMGMSAIETASRWKRAFLGCAAWTFAVLCGFFLLYFFEHDLEYVGERSNALRMESRCLCALTVSPMCLAGAFLCGVASNRQPRYADGIKLMGEAFLLVVGLSWMKVLGEVVFAGVRGASYKASVLSAAAVHLTLVFFVVLPSWAWFVLPSFQSYVEIPVFACEAEPCGEHEDGDFPPADSGAQEVDHPSAGSGSGAAPDSAPAAAAEPPPAAPAAEPPPAAAAVEPPPPAADAAAEPPPAEAAAGEADAEDASY
eukprot:TRINITY_DN15050_c1_g1_i1.p1 TRINITY_DN15050_c1_g1~~TRINITY_DN15050_c1_g1_i1.p1  ORF type:complete len:649 (-),score=93.12 TRINITY_DN15050_c1_g1_i1:140-2005(-)